MAASTKVPYFRFILLFNISCTCVQLCMLCCIQGWHCLCARVPCTATIGQLGGSLHVCAAASSRLSRCSFARTCCPVGSVLSCVLVTCLPCCVLCCPHSPSFARCVPKYLHVFCVFHPSTLLLNAGTHHTSVADQVPPAIL